MSSILPNRILVLIGTCLCLAVIAQGQGVSADADIKEGLSYIQARKFKEAVKAFDRARDKDPQNAFAHYGLAVALANLKAYKEAIRPLLKSLRLNPDPHWGDINKEMVLSLLAEVERNAKTQAKTYEITYEYDRFKNLTTVQVEAGQTVAGLHFGVGYLSSGYLLSKPNHFFLRFDSHSRDWRFLDESSRDLNVLVDGKPIRLGVMERIKDRINTNRYGVSVNERLLILVPYEQFFRFAQGKVLEMQLGGSEFKFSDKQIQALQDLMGSFSEDSIRD